MAIMISSAVSESKARMKIRSVCFLKCRVCVQKLLSPLTETVVVWCTEPSRFRAVQRYSPPSASDTSVIRRVLLKFWKEAL